jgi:chorismate-pyruvate lyase
MGEEAAMSVMPDGNLNMTPEPILGAHYRMPGLSDVERILVVSDGTFTYQLETFVREPIGVEILSNELAPLSPSDAQLLQCREGGLVWDRRTLLRGKQTSTAYCYATSVINDEDLDPDFRAELRVTQSGIGHLMAKYRMGTFRELLTYHINAEPNYAHHLPHFRDAAFLSRNYRIVFEGRPIMLITENMPRNLFAKSIPLDHTRASTTP